MEMETGGEMERVETEAVAGMDSERVETEAVAGMDSERVETRAVDGMDSERVETRAVDGMDSERVETEAVDGMDSDRVETEAVDGMDSERVETVAADGMDSERVETEAVDGMDSERVETEAVDGMDSERVETEAVNGMDSERVETEAVDGMDSERVETEAVDGMDSERVETEAVDGMDSERVETQGVDEIPLEMVETQAIDGMPSERVENRVMEDMNVGTMGAGGLAAANDFDVRVLVENLACQVDVDAAVSEGVSALNGRHTLNLNGVFSSYMEDDRRRALAFVFRLVDGAHIKCLLLQYNKIDLAGLERGLQNFKGDSLQEIDLSCNLLMGEGVAAFWTINWSNLRKLVLRRNNIEDLDCTGIAGAIQAGQLRSLRSIDLSENHIQDAGIVNLASVFQKKFLPQLQELALDRNSFGDAGVIKIAEAISAGGLQLLQHLGLRFNTHIGISSMVTLITSFASGQACHLKMLDFQNMRFGPDVAMELTKAIESGGLKSLQRLFLGRNWGKEDKHLLALLFTLGNGHALNLRELHLTLSNGVIKELARAIQLGNLKSLEKLSMDLSGHSNLTEEDKETGGSLEHLLDVLSKGHWGKEESLRELCLKLNSTAAVKLTTELEARSLKVLTSLDLSCKGMGETSILSLIATLSGGQATNLQGLHLRGMMVSDDVSFEITHAIESGNLRSLKKLHLSKVKGELLVSLATASRKGYLVDLQELMLMGSGFGSNGIVELVKSIDSNNLQSLAKLELLGTWKLMGGKSLVSLAAMLGKWQTVNLQQVQVNGIEWGYDGLKLGNAEQNIRWEDDDIMELARAMDLGNLNLLVNLDLSGSLGMPVSPKPLEFFSTVLGKGQMVKLRELHLQHVYWKGDGFTELARAIGSGTFKLLTVLDLTGIWGMTNRSVVSLAAALGKGHMVNLRELILQKCDWDDDAVMELANAIGSGCLKTVTTLDLSSNDRVTTKSLVFLAAALGAGHMIDLRELLLGQMGAEGGLGFLGWDDNAVLELAKAIRLGSLKSLAVLDLSGIAKISGKSLVPLAIVLGRGHMVNLQQLLFNGIEWGMDGMKVGADGINWEDEDIIELSRAMESGSLKSIVKLHVSGSKNVTGKSLVYLAAAFGKGEMVNLQELQLCKVWCSDEGIVELSKAIRSGNLQSLKTLEISRTRYCEEKSLAGLVALVGAGHLLHLKSFNLKHSGLGSTGALAIANAIDSRKLPSLQILDVDRNPNIDLPSTLELQRICSLHQIQVLPDFFKSFIDLPGNKEENKGADNTPQQGRATKLRMDHVGATSSSSVASSWFVPNVLEGKLVKEEDEVKGNVGDNSHPEASNTHHKSSSRAATSDDLESRLYVQGDKQVGEKQGMERKDEGHSHQEDSKANQGKDGDKSNIDKDGRRFGSILMSEGLQFRQDVQCLGLRSWDDMDHEGRMLVLGDVTSSDEQLHFVFFHKETMVRLFGCGLPFSKVTILLDQQLVWIQELKEEPWKAFWMNPCQDNWRLLLFEEAKCAQHSDAQDSAPQGFQLNQRQALSRFGVSLDGSSLHEFVKSKGFATTGAEGDFDWEPVWISWVKSVINNAFANDSTPNQLRKRMDALSCKHAPGTSMTRRRGKEAVVDHTVQANTSLQHEMERGKGCGRSSLTVIVTFNCPACPLFKYSTDRKLAEKFTDDRTSLPQAISHIEPTLTVEFFRNAQEKFGHHNFGSQISN